jgi:hypothetical protein
MNIQFWLESLKGVDHSIGFGLNRRIIIKYILGYFLRGCGLDASGSGWRLVAGTCKHGNEPSVFKARNFLTI